MIVVAAIAAGSVIVLTIFVFLICWKCKNSKKTAQDSDRPHQINVRSKEYGTPSEKESMLFKPADDKPKEKKTRDQLFNFDEEGSMRQDTSSSNNS